MDGKLGGILFGGGGIPIGLGGGGIMEDGGGGGGILGAEMLGR